jgi:hypothetical protein
MRGVGRWETELRVALRCHERQARGLTVIDLQIETTPSTGDVNCEQQTHDPVYLFACHLEWRLRGDLSAYRELIAALDDSDPEIRAVAETLLRRPSPRPKGAGVSPNTQKQEVNKPNVIGHQ